MRAERDGRAAVDDAGVEQYRLVARALRTPRIDPVPLEFAMQTAARAAREARLANEAFEIWLGRALVASLLVAGAIAIRVYGGESLLDFSFSVPDGATFGIRTVVSWSLAVAACIGISSAFAFAGKR
jgi:hypothetical protein